MGKQPLMGGARRLLGDHSGRSGRVYRRAFDALAEEFDLSTRLLRMEASRVAAAWVNLDAASQALADLRRKRETGKGQRPTTRDVERAARRQGLADTSYAQALSQLRLIAPARKPMSLADLFSQVHAEDHRTAPEGPASPPYADPDTRI